jgi:type 1 fimbriae regulatory protein FimB/type 1 fimbriae regulatory protein FimE
MTKRKSNTPQYLTEAQFKRLHNCADCARDKAILLTTYRHGLRASEVAGLEWSDLDLNAGTIKVHRVKGSSSGTHEILGDEMRALKAWRKEQQAEAAAKDQSACKLVFTGQRGAMTPNGLNRLIHAIAERDPELPPLHFHTVRHSTGYALANQGRPLRAIAAWLGHRNIQNTMLYTQLAPNAFKGFWR